MSEYSIGVDLGGTNLRAAAIGKNGELLERTNGGTNLSAGRDAVIDDIVAAIAGVRSRLPGLRLAGVGIGVPGFILMDKGYIVGSNNLPELEGFPVRDAIEQRSARRSFWRTMRTPPRSARNGWAPDAESMTWCSSLSVPASEEESFPTAA